MAGEQVLNDFHKTTSITKDTALFDKDSIHRGGELVSNIIHDEVLVDQQSMRLQMEVHTLHQQNAEGCQGQNIEMKLSFQSLEAHPTILLISVTKMVMLGHPTWDLASSDAFVAQGDGEDNTADAMTKA
ncbi:hypothetical protein E4U44_000464 [Claviceps purpurea]|nr:hypothetical protein E4U44_000464 [Claviceps purpurea]